MVVWLSYYLCENLCMSGKAFVQMLRISAPIWPVSEKSQLLCYSFSVCFCTTCHVPAAFLQFWWASSNWAYCQEGLGLKSVGSRDLYPSCSRDLNSFLGLLKKLRWGMWQSHRPQYLASPSVLPWKYLLTRQWVGGNIGCSKCLILKSVLAVLIDFWPFEH